MTTNFAIDTPTNVSRGPDARWFLRNGTRDLHDQAEQALGDGAVQEIQPYIGMLRSNLDMTETVLQAVERSLPRSVVAGLERDRARLRSDLADLSAVCPPRKAAMDVPGKPAALGALYVCEGARLGGRVLAAQVEEHLRLTADHGAAYLNGDGSGAGARWRGFVATLNRDVVGPDDLDRALRAARTVFNLIIANYRET